MVRATRCWPTLNSPMVPRSEITMTVGICEGTVSEASALAISAKPEVCIITTLFRPPIQAPATTPTASSSRVAQTERKVLSDVTPLSSGVSTLSGT